MFDLQVEEQEIFGRRPSRLPVVKTFGTDHEWVVLSVASYSLNAAAVRHTQELIDARQYVLDSDWGEVQP